MLRRAQEIANISLAAKKRIEESRRHEEEYEAELERRAAAIAAGHAKFEPMARSAAKRGQQHILVCGLKLDEARLVKQGFAVSHFVRKAAFEAHLQSLVEGKERLWRQLCERLAADGVALERASGDSLLRRNPLASWMESRWERNEFSAALSLDEFLTSVQRDFALADSWIDKHRGQLQELLCVLKEFKQVEGKYKAIKQNNDQIPEGRDEAFLVSWGDASTDDANELRRQFSASRLKWLAEDWQGLETFLSKPIERAAKRGEMYVEFEGLFEVDEQTWWLNDPDSNPTTDLMADVVSMSIRSPSVVCDELIQLGYEASLSAYTHDDETDTWHEEALDEDSVLTSEQSVVYGLTVRWTSSDGPGVQT